MKDVDSLRPVRWGLGDALVGYLVANTAAFVGGTIILAIGGYEAGSTDGLPLTMVAALQVPLWLGYLGVPAWAARHKGNGLVRDFRLRFRWADAPIGLAAGAATQLALLPLLYVPILWIFDGQDVGAPARDLAARATDGTGVALLVLVTVGCAPVIEEIFFRGLLMGSLDRRLGPRWALVLSSVAFGGVHFQLIQLPGLVLAGLVFGALAQRTGRLGPAVWAHVGFNGAAVAVLLTT